jgi:hypothetical protein
MLLDLKDIDFTPLTESKNLLAIDSLKSLVEKGGVPDQDAELAQLAGNINNIPSAESKQVFKELLRSEDIKTPIKYLFGSRIFQLINQINRNLPDQRKEFFDAVADPIWVVAKEKARTDFARSPSKFPIVELLNKFRPLSETGQNELLHHLAISLYQTGGSNSLDPLRLLVVQARAHDNITALFTASLINVPLLLICLLLGGFFASKLVARDRMRELVHKETLEYPIEDSAYGNPVKLFGREGLLISLRSLTERGWSTIGVVGRRGVGKSRILHALSQPEVDAQAKPTIRVWISSPSKFHEEDFISSMFERLAFSTESAIAADLNVKPISIRRIESRAAQVGICFYAGAMFVLSLLIYNMASRLTRPDIVITWIPVLAIILTSIGFFISYISKLQPVDLSSWLQRDRTHNPHTVMLYREVYRVLTYLRRRSHSTQVDNVWPKGGFVRLGGLFLSGGFVFYGGFFGVVALFESAPARFFIPYFSLCLLSLSAWLFLYYFRAKSGELTGSYGQSLMSLIAEYRAFASTIVYRLKQGALGHSRAQIWGARMCG